MYIVIDGHLINTYNMMYMEMEINEDSINSRLIFWMREKYVVTIKGTVEEIKEKFKTVNDLLNGRDVNYTISERKRLKPFMINQEEEIFPGFNQF